MTALPAVILIALVAFRIWRFFALDDLTDLLRDRLPERVTHPLVCAWCAGSWIAFLVTAALDLTLRAWRTGNLATPSGGVEAPIAVALAAAAVVGLAGRWLE